MSVILRVKHIGNEIRTWAFVEYASPEVVKPAIAGSDSLELGGVPCTVEARKSTPTPRCCAVGYMILLYCDVMEVFARKKKQSGMTCGHIGCIHVTDA